MKRELGAESRKTPIGGVVSLSLPGYQTIETFFGFILTAAKLKVTHYHEGSDVVSPGIKWAKASEESQFGYIGTINGIIGIGLMDAGVYGIKAAFLGEDPSDGPIFECQSNQLPSFQRDILAALWLDAIAYCDLHAGTEDDKLLILADLVRKAAS